MNRGGTEDLVEVFSLFGLRVEDDADGAYAVVFLMGGTGDCENCCGNRVRGVEVEGGGVEAAGGGEEGDVKIYVVDFGRWV